MWLWGWVACGGVDEASFPDRYVDAFCARAVECAGDVGMTGVRYGSEEECAESVSLTVPPGDGCVFDEAAARSCLDQLQTATCATFEGAAGCALVYSDCG